MRRLLVLRPEPGASATVARAKVLGLDGIAVPLFEIEPIEWTAADAERFDGLLLTSANAVRHGGSLLGGLRKLGVYAVGAATAEASREAGFAIVQSGDSGIDDLLGSLEPGLTLLHLCGEDRLPPADARQRITSIPVYRARAVETPRLRHVRGAVVLVHSPRAGRRFAEIVQDRGTIAIAAISENAAEAVGSGWQVVEAAERPTDEALLALAARLCNNPPPK